MLKHRPTVRTRSATLHQQNSGLGVQPVKEHKITIIYQAECIKHGNTLYQNCLGCTLISTDINKMLMIALKQFQSNVNAQNYAHIRLPGDD